jgi:succinylglutamate desuccinylase
MRRLSGALALVLLVGLTVLAPSVAARPSASDAVARTSRAAVLELRVIGHSVKGRPIRAWHLGDPTSPVKAVFVAAMHGNEARPAAILRNLRDGRPIVGADVWVVPVLNPDGVHRHSRRNAHGVDLNRNFPVRWIHQGGSYYSGPRPASEPETKAMMAFLADVRPRYVVSLHQPLYGVDTSYAKTRALGRRLVRYLHLPRKRFTCNNGCHGTMTQWFNQTLPGAAITVEYGHRLTHRQKYVTGPRGLLRSIRATR